MTANLHYFVLAIFLASSAILFLGLIAMKPKKRPEEPVSQPKPPAKQLFQLNEQVDLLEQCLTIIYKDKRKLTIYIRETMKDDGVCCYDKYVDVKYKTFLTHMRDAILNAAQYKTLYSFDNETDTPHIVNLEDIFEIQYEDPYPYDSKETVSWVQEE